MGNRLSKIYTRTGDKGVTGLGDGSRVDKDDARIEAIGDVDELNCQLGVLITALDAQDPLRELLSAVQQDLFDIGGELSIPGHTMVEAERTDFLERQLDRYNAALPPLKNFVLPGGSPAAAHSHLARAVCRRAERRLVSLNQQAGLNPAALQYINRLSDLLFVLARTLARRNAGQEVLWRQPQRR